MDEQNDDYSDLDDVLARARAAELAATGEDYEETRKLFDRHRSFRITTPRVGVNPIMKIQLRGTTLGKGAFGFLGDPEDRLLGQLAGLVAPDVEEDRLTPSPAPERVTTPESVPVTASEDLTCTVPQVQWDLWEEQLKSTDPKQELAALYWEYVPVLLKKYPSTLQVLAYLLAQKSPADLGRFKVSYRQVAAGTELSRRSVQDAMQNLVMLGVLVVDERPSREDNIPGVYHLEHPSTLRQRIASGDLGKQVSSGSEAKDLGK